MREGYCSDDFEARSAHEALIVGWQEAYDRWASHIDKMPLEQVCTTMDDITKTYGLHDDPESFWARVYNALEERKYELVNGKGEETDP